MTIESTSRRYALFATAIGTCGIAWSGARLVATQLPEATEAGTAERLAARSGATAAVGEPPGPVAAAIAAITALLAGGRTDLAFIDCDLAGLDPLAVRVYEITRTIPAGQTLTYGEIAGQLGDRSLARLVGQALGRNPFPIVVPCHRVMGADGRLTGFSANGGVATKLRMLTIEGARLAAPPGLFDDLPLAVRPPPAARSGRPPH